METKNHQHWPQINEAILFLEEHLDHVGIRSFHNIHEDEIELALITNDIIILLNNNIKENDKSNI